MHKYASGRRFMGAGCQMPWEQYLYEVHASVKRNGGHGACVVVRHLHCPVPLTAIAIEKHSEASSDQLIESRNLLHVHCELECDVAEQRGGDVASCASAWAKDLQSPHQRGQDPQERKGSLQTKQVLLLRQLHQTAQSLWFSCSEGTVLHSRP